MSAPITRPVVTVVFVAVFTFCFTVTLLEAIKLIEEERAR